MEYFNNNRHLIILFINGQPVEFSNPIYYAPPSPGIQYTYPVPIFQPNMIRPTVSYVAKFNINPTLQLYGAY